MSFKINSLYLTDGYKIGHKAMLAPGTTKLYGTWIPRSTKHAPKGITKIVSFGQQLVWKWIHDEFEENFFRRNYIERETELLNERGYDNKFLIENVKKESLQFVKDMSLYLGMEYDGKHFEELWDLGYLPIKVKALPEGIETNPNIPHMTFINTVDGFAWLTLYLETVVSALAWKPSTAATIAKLYRRQCEEWVMKTDPNQAFLIDFMCHDFSARGLDPMSQYLIGLGHATSFKGSDTLPVIPAARYFYGVKDDEMPIYSVNASEQSVSTTKIFTVGEQQMITDWLKIFPKGILSIVSDTFDLWKLITEYLPANKEAIMARDGKLVIRPDSGDPVDIICGPQIFEDKDHYNDYELDREAILTSEEKGVIELLWDIFGGTVNEQGYKVLDPHIGAIYGDSITPERQRQIYERLADKGFAATNIILGVGSYTYQYNTRDTLGFACKGAWFEVRKETGECSLGGPENGCPDGSEQLCDFGNKCICPETVYKSYNIYKDPITDEGTKRSLKGMCIVSREIVNWDTKEMDYVVYQECNPKHVDSGKMPYGPEEDVYDELKVIYEDGKFYNQTNLEEVRKNLLRQ